MEKRTSGPRNFARDVFLVMVAVALLAAGAVVFLVMQVRRDISEQYIQDATELAVAEFQSMKDSVEGSLAKVRDWGASGLVSLSDPDKLRVFMLPFMSQERLFAGTCIADREGTSVYIQPDGAEVPHDDTFDVLSRPWFGPALETDGVVWTEQYLFHTLQQIGITASVAFTQPETGEKTVVAFDILLTDLYHRIEEMAPSDNSDFIIFRRDAVLFLPEAPARSSGFVPFESSDNSVVSRAHDFWRKGHGLDDEVFSFLHQGQVWWCGFRPLEETHHNIWMGVIVPETDIMGRIDRRRIQLLAFGTGLVLAVVISGIWLSRRYRRMLSEAHPSPIGNTAEEIQELIEKGENRYVEFKSTIRMNLHSKKPGKEIELAWLKGVAAFMNTDGGSLLLGVTDAGEITGVEQDVFENEDKCRLHFKNLIANHIGADFSKYIRFVLVPVDGKTVGVVHCSRASEPVFLKDGNKEYFYIRNGPSSDELPVSKAINYIKSR